MDNKEIKNILTGAGLVSLVAGQFLILGGGHTALGITLTVACAVLFALAFTEKFTLISDVLKKMAEITRNLAAPGPAQKPGGPIKAVKGKHPKTAPPPVVDTPEDKISMAPAFNLAACLSKIASEGIDLRIPKWTLYALVAALFCAAQFFFLTGKFLAGIMILVASVVIAAAAIAIKEDMLSARLNFRGGLKVLSMLSGSALIVAGWALLLNRNTPIQQWGVALTIPGCIIAYLGLPKSDATAVREEDTRSDILFLKPDILNNYFVKAALLILAIISLKAGWSVMQEPGVNMYSMIFYFIAIVLLFFGLPLFNFAEKPYDNKYFDIAKLAAVCIAVYIAYLAQKDFTVNRMNEGVVKYLAAAFIFIFAFPVYSSKIKEEKEPFPVKAEILFLAAIILAGLYLRVHELGLRPFGIENDESGGYTARMSMRGDPTLPLSVGNFGLPLHIVQFFILFTGELNRMSIKLLGVSVGLLSIPMIYFFIRSTVNPRAAIFATALFTFLRWNLHFSRSGHGYVFSNAVEILALYFLIKALETRKKMVWCLAGLCVGLTWHGVMTAFLLIVPIALYVVISSFSRRDYLRSNIVGIFAFIFGFWMFGSMITHNFFLSKSIYFSRVNEVSVFSKDPNAPIKNPAKGIVENTRLVLEMFNGMGDSRSRNSGGNPYEPTIDFTSSMLFAVGFIYSIYYSKFYLFFIMAMTFFSQAAGSIFSIEAPSAMRALGTMIPVIFMIAFVFDKIWLSVRKVFGRKLEIIYLPLLLALFLVPIIRDNYSQYFGRWIGGMDELATATGKYTRSLGDKWRVVLYTSTYYPGHPPFKLHRDSKADSAGRLTQALTHLRQVEGDNFALLFHYDTWQNLASIKNVFFPESKLQVVDHKMFNPGLKEGEEGFGTFAKAVLVTNEELKKKRGLAGVYSFGGAPVPDDEPVFRASDNSRVPYSVTWKGDFLAPYYGLFRFYNSGNVKFGLVIDGKSVAQEGAVRLAEGFHRITITATRGSAGDTLLMKVDCAGLSSHSFLGRETVALDHKYLYNFRVTGLHGYYYDGEPWELGRKDAEIIDTNMWFDGSVYTASALWRGTINIPADGDYFITASCNNYARIVIDNGMYWEQSGNKTSLDQAAVYFRGKPMRQVAGFKLSKGSHSIVVYDLNSNILHLLWKKGAEEPAPIPADALEPDFEITKQ